MSLGLVEWWRRRTRPRARLVIDSRAGLRLTGWAAGGDGRAESPVGLHVDGREVPVTVYRTTRLDVATQLRLDPEEPFGFELMLPLSLWDSQAPRTSVFLCCQDSRVPLSIPPNISMAIEEMLDLPPSWHKEQQIHRLTSHLQSLENLHFLKTSLRGRLEDALEARYGVRQASRIPSTISEPPQVQGFVEGLRGLTIFGWALGRQPGRESVWLRANSHLIHVRARRTLRPDVSQIHSISESLVGWEVDIPSKLWTQLPSDELALNVELLIDLQPVSSSKAIRLTVVELESSLNQLPILDSKQILLEPISTRLQHLLVIEHCETLYRLQRLSQQAASCLVLHSFALNLPTDQYTPSLSHTIRGNTAMPAEVWLPLRQLNDLIARKYTPIAALQAIWQTLHRPELQQEWLMSVTPWACRNSVFPWVSDRVEEKVWVALAQQPSRWALTLALVWLTHAGNKELAYDVSNRLFETPKDAAWLNTECILGTVTTIVELCEREKNPSSLYVDTLINIIRLIIDDSTTVWGRGHDACLTTSASLLVRHALKNPSLASLNKECVRLVDAQSFNLAFWEELGKALESPPSWLSERHSFISRWVASFTTHTPPIARDEELLGRMISDGSSEAQRWYTEWLYFESANKPSHSVMASACPAEFLRTCHMKSTPPHGSSFCERVQAALFSLAKGHKSKDQPDLCIVFAKLFDGDPSPDGALLSELTDAGFRWIIASPGTRSMHLDQDTRNLELTLQGQPKTSAAFWISIMKWFQETSSAEGLCIAPSSAVISVAELQGHDAEVYPYLGPTDYWARPPIEATSAIDRLTDSVSGDPESTAVVLSAALVRRILTRLKTSEGQTIYSSFSSANRVILELASMEGIHPAAHSPRTLHPVPVHLSSAKKDSCKTLLKSKWPTERSPSLSHPHQDNLLRALSSFESDTLADDSAVVVIAAIRNERTILPHFLAHYRSLGVTCFIFVDNKSTDGSTDFLLEQADTIVYSAESDYKSSHYGVSWQRTVLAHHCIGKWAIIVDADEFLLYPDFEHVKLVDWISELEANNQTAAFTPQIDLYPNRPLSEVDFREEMPLESARWFDAEPLQAWHLGSGSYSNSPTLLSGFRHRVIENAPPNAFTAQKIALVKYYPWIHFSEGLHYASNVKTGPHIAFLAHLKYHKDFHRRVLIETQREQHFSGASEYREYGKWLPLFEKAGLSNQSTEELTSSARLHKIRNSLPL